MSKIKGTNIAAPIVPYSTIDSYPTHYAKYGKGGYMSLATLAERDSIPEERLEEGMLVFVLEDGQSYQYLNGEWVSAKVGKEDSLRFEGSTHYNARIENGTVVAYNEVPTYRLEQPTKLDQYNYIKINSFYLGLGTGNSAHNFLPCSHRFIELANTGDTRTSIDGLFIKIYYNNRWETLELNGIIEAGSTYLVRGEQTSVINADTTRIKVNQYNQAWDSSNIDATNGVMFYLCWGDEKGKILNAAGEFIDYPKTRNDIYESLSYVDCVSTSDSTITGNGIKRENVNAVLKNVIFVRRYPLDPCYIDEKDNTIDWRYHFINDDRYAPAASYEGKDISWGTNWIKDDGKPITVTCTVGRLAEPTYGYSDIHSEKATRFFTWTTMDSNCDRLFIRRLGPSGADTNWSSFPGIYSENGNPVEAYSRASSLSKVKNSNLKIEKTAYYEVVNQQTPISNNLFSYYNRAKWETYTGEVIYTYRFLLSITSEGVYEYCCGKADEAGLPIEGTLSKPRYLHIISSNMGERQPRYLQVGNFNVSTLEDAALLNYTTGTMVEKFSASSTQSNLANLKYDFIVNTGNLVKHGTRPEEWIYYINNNKLLDYYAEFITPGEHDLGEIHLYEVGKRKVNYRMFDLFYTFELNTENTPTMEPFGVSGVMPGLYSTFYCGHLLTSFNSTITTNPLDLTEQNTTNAVMGFTDEAIVLPGENINLGVASKYYKKEIEWLFREIYYYWNRLSYLENMPLWSDYIEDSVLCDPDFTKEFLPDEDNKYFPDFVTIVTNHAPIEPYTDEIFDRREEGDIEHTRSSVYNTVDNLNNHLYFLTSRYFKIWQIKSVLSNNDWGIGGITRKIHDANQDYNPPINDESNYADQLITGALENYDTYQPIIIVDNSKDATELVRSQETRYIWNGSGITLVIEFDSGSYISIPPGGSEFSGLVWDAKYSVLLSGKDVINYRNISKAPRYVLLNSSLKSFSLKNNEFGETYNYTSSEKMRPWFEGNSFSTDLNRIQQRPTFIYHLLAGDRKYIQDVDLYEGRDTITYKGVIIVTNSGNIELSNYENWNPEEDLYQLNIDMDIFKNYFGIYVDGRADSILGPIYF